MSAASNRHALRARIAEAFAFVLETKAHRALGRELGIAGTTVSARGSDPNAWPLAEALDLAADHEQLGNAVVAYVRGETSTRAAGEATRLREDEKAELLINARIDQAVLADFDHSTPAGRAAIREAITSRRLIENRLLADFDMVDGVRRG